MDRVGKVSAQPNILLHCPVNDDQALENFVSAALEAQVALIACWGDGCEGVHDTIDEIIVGDGSGPTSALSTTWHTNESLDEALEFASFFEERGVREVRLS